MRKVITYFLLCGCILVLSTVKAQVSPYDLKTARNAVYEWIGNYDVYARCEGRNAKSNFYSLFDSEDSLIFNDYLPMMGYDFDNPLISVKEYVELVRDKNSKYQIKYEILDGKIISEEYRRGKLKYIVSMEKKVWFVERGNISDVRYEYPTRKLVLTATLEYRVPQAELVATSLTCEDNIPSFVILHEGKSNTVYSKRSSVDNVCKTRSTQLVKYSFNTMDFDEKMLEISVDTLKRYLGFGYTVGKENVKALISDERISDFSVTGGTQHSVWSSYFHQFSLKDNQRWGIELGLLFKSSSCVLNSQWLDRYHDIDPDGSPYERIIFSNNYFENISRNILELPMTIRYEYLIDNQFSVFSQAGVSVGYSLLNKTDATAEMEYSGYYEWLYHVTLSQNGIYDFGQFPLSNSARVLGLQQLMFGSVFSIGACYYFLDNWMFEIAFRYRGTILNGINREEDYHLSKQDGDWSSLTYLLDNYKTNAFNFHLQINYNF